MKKVTFYFLAVIMFMSISPIQSHASMVSDSTQVQTTTLTSNPDAPVPPEVQVLLDRLDEINAMDKANLSREEKRALRKEVRATEHQLREIGGGVYISAGAIILILILLIIFL